MTVQDIVLAHSVPSTITDDMDHLRRLAQIIGYPARVRIAQRMFVLQVTASIINEFRFRAVVDQGAYKLWLGDSFAGDIPDAGIERILVARDLRVFETMTIHSNQPLEVLKGTDPVVIGWFRPTPYARIRQDRPYCDEIGSGLVIAMWDMDKELSGE